MNCFLHIGTEKTGSTTIQYFLDQNRETLRSHGILFTDSLGLRNNRKLPVTAYLPSRRDEYTRQCGLVSDGQLISHQHQIIDLLRMELRKTQDIDSVIFSSEHIHSRLRTEIEIEKLGRILKELGFTKIVVIVYIREQVDAVSSLYNTAVLYDSRSIPPPRPFEDEYWDNLCDHKSTITRYSRVFGRNNLVPRLFCKHRFTGGTLITDFLHALGLEINNNSLSLPDRKNESISNLGLELLRKLNSKPTWCECNKISSLAITNIFKEIFQKGYKYRLPNGLSSLYQEAFRESNEWVRREYFPNLDNLFPQYLPTGSNFLKLSDLEIEQITNLICCVIDNVGQG